METSKNKKNMAKYKDNFGKDLEHPHLFVENQYNYSVYAYDISCNEQCKNCKG